MAPVLSTPATEAELLRLGRWVNANYIGGMCVLDGTTERPLRNIEMVAVRIANQVDGLAELVRIYSTINGAVQWRTAAWSRSGRRLRV